MSAAEIFEVSNLVLNLLTITGLIVCTAYAVREIRAGAEVARRVEKQLQLSEAAMKSTMDAVADFRRIVKHVAQDVKVNAEIAAEKLRAAASTVLPATGTVEVHPGESVVVKAPKEE